MIPTGLEIKYKDKGNEGCMLWGWVEQSDLVRGLWERALNPNIHSMSVGSSTESSTIEPHDTNQSENSEQKGVNCHMTLTLQAGVVDRFVV